MPNEEHRQHINLSTHANAIIAMDMAAFERKGTVSGFINRIFLSFWEDAEAMIPNAVERYRTSLENDLRRSKYHFNNPNDEQPEGFVEDRETLGQSERGLVKRLADEYRIKTIERMNSFPRGVAIKIRLQNAVYELIYEDEASEWIGPEGGCYRCQGDYIKAVVEEYARKTFFGREEIIYRKLLDELEMHRRAFATYNRER